MSIALFRGLPRVCGVNHGYDRSALRAACRSHIPGNARPLPYPCPVASPLPRFAGSGVNHGYGRAGPVGLSLPKGLPSAYQRVPYPFHESRRPTERLMTRCSGEESGSTQK